MLRQMNWQDNLCGNPHTLRFTADDMLEAMDADFDEHICERSDDDLSADELEGYGSV